MSKNGTLRSNIRPGLRVAIVLKKDQPTGRRTVGIVGELLTGSANHPRGIKVRLTDGQVGRVQEILEGAEADLKSAYLIVQDLEARFLCGCTGSKYSICLNFTYDAQIDARKAAQGFSARIGGRGAPEEIFLCSLGRPVFHTFQPQSAIAITSLPAGAHFDWIGSAQLDSFLLEHRLLEKSSELYLRLRDEFDIRNS